MKYSECMTEEELTKLKQELAEEELVWASIRTAEDMAWERFMLEREDMEELEVEYELSRYWAP